MEASKLCSRSEINSMATIASIQCGLFLKPKGLAEEVQLAREMFANPLLSHITSSDALV